MHKSIQRGKEAIEFKTFQEFVRHACRSYKLSYEMANSFIQDRLNRFNLTPKIIVCYINWADNACLTQQQIASQLGVNRSTISRNLQKLADVWPHLFNFGRRIPDLRDMLHYEEWMLNYSEFTKRPLQVKRQF